jgi:hypothetical protein
MVMLLLVLLNWIDVNTTKIECADDDPDLP